MTKNVLVIGPSWVGDAVMSQSLFKLLKQQNAEIRIDVLAPAWTFSLLQRMPEVNQAIEFPLTHGQLGLRQRYRIAQQLRTNAYDQAIVLPNSFKSALVPWFARIPQRTGWLGEYRYGLLNDIRHLDQKKYSLMVEQYMALALAPNQPLSQPYPYPSFKITTLSEATLNKIKQQPTHQQNILALCPGAAFGSAKCWPAAYYARVAQEKLAAGWQVWLLGSQHDRLITDEIMTLTDDRCDNLAGTVTLAETIDLLSLVSGVVSNDSGLMHVAAALQKPLIAVYGPTSPAFTPPLATNAKVLQLNLSCQPCFQRTCPLHHHRCMQSLTPSQVLAEMSVWGK